MLFDRNNNSKWASLVPCSECNAAHNVFSCPSTSKVFLFRGCGTLDVGIWPKPFSDIGTRVSYSGTAVTLSNNHCSRPDAVSVVRGSQLLFFRHGTHPSATTTMRE
jgi:hypothetical protein